MKPSRAAESSQTSEQITICAKCRHFKTTREGRIWYDQFCGHPDLENPLVIDPVTGRQGYGSKNDLGRTILADTPHPHAREINDGNCHHYESYESTAKGEM